MTGTGKARAFLTEFIIVILFFSLSIVIALQLFLKADEKSKDSKNRTMAYVVAEQTAEHVKADALNREVAKEGAYEGWFDNSWAACTEEEAEFLLSVNTFTESTEGGKLLRATIKVTDIRGRVICELPVTVYCRESEASLHEK